jgi:hypothetical protein
MGLLAALLISPVIAINTRSRCHDGAILIDLRGTCGFCKSFPPKTTRDDRQLEIIPRTIVKARRGRRTSPSELCSSREALIYFSAEPFLATCWPGHTRRCNSLRFVRIAPVSERIPGDAVDPLLGPPPIAPQWP